MKVTENSTYRLMQTNLDRITNELQDLRNQGATGLKLNNPSDDPSAIRPVLTTRTQIRHTDRYLETMGVSADKMQSTDGHMEHVENLLQRVKELSINAVNGALGDSDLDALGDEVEQLKYELLDAANAMVDGKYIFAGYQENTIPFVENTNYDSSLWDQNNPNTWPYIYQGDANPTRLEITPGELLETTLTGNDLFFGISNSTAQSGNPTQPPLTGMQQGAPLVLPATGDITINALGPPVIAETVTAAMINTATDNNAQQLAGLLDGSTNGVLTGISATITSSSSSNSGTFTPTTGAADSFSVNGEILVSGASPDSFVFDSKIDSYISGVAAADPNRAGGSISDGDAWFTDSNDNIITISGSAQDGNFLFESTDGANITVTEAVTDPTQGFTTSAYANGSETTYGTVNIGTNTADNVTIAGAGLAAAGLTAATLDGATQYAPDTERMDMFSALVRLEESLRAGNLTDPDGPGGSVNQAIENLEIVADQERRLRSKLGTRAARVDAATLHQQDVKVDLEQLLSRYQDADAIETFNDIIRQETAFQAALSITAKVSKISILNYF